MLKTIGKCSLCGGYVMAFVSLTIPYEPECATCGSKESLPVIKMKKIKTFQMHSKFRF